MDMVILGSDEEEDSDVAGITGGVCGVAGGAEGVTSGIGSIEGIAGAGALMSAVSQPAVAPLAALDVEYLDALLQLGLPALHYRLSYSSICRE